MATNYNYKNILLKDSNGQVLLPITLSYYVEYKDGTSVKSYLDTLGSNLGDVNGYIDGINGKIDNINEKIALNGEVQQNIINSVNDILTSYVAKPDYAYAVVFDNKTNTGLSDSLKNLKAVEGSSYVSTQQAIEAIDARVTSTYSYANELGGKIDGLVGDLGDLDKSVQGLGRRVDTVETTANYAYTKVNTLFGSDGNLDLTASSIKYTGKPDAGTDGKTNVQDAIDTIGTKLQSIQADIDDVTSKAGVTSITGYNGILIKDESGKPAQGAVTVKVNLDNEKLSLNEGGAITVVDSALSIAASQINGLIPANKIEGGLDANNINITYSYTGDDSLIHVDGKKSVQEFYNETETKIKDLEAASKAETLDGKYKVTVETNTPEGSEFAKVYTIKQGTNKVGEINIPKDQFLKKVEYVDAAHAPSGAQEGDYPALVFTWNLSDADETTGAPTSIVPIASFVDAITSEIVKDVTALKTDVETLKTSVKSIESSYITGAKINGQTVEVVDHVLQLSYNILYESGSSTDGVSEGFLQNNGIKLS